MVVAPAGAGASGAGAAGGTGGVGGVGPPTPLVTDARQGYTATNMWGELYLVSEEKLRELDATVLAYGAPRSQARRKVEVEYMERPPGEQPVRTPREAWVYVWPAALGLPLGLPEVRPAGDWCLARESGKEVMANGGALPFEAARTFARTMKLGSWKEWNEYSKSGKRPSNIPSSPDTVYRDAGWVSFPDWMGYEGKEVLTHYNQCKDQACMVCGPVRQAIQRRHVVKSGGQGGKGGKGGKGDSSESLRARWAPKKMQQAKPAKKAAAFLPPPVGNTNGVQSRKRARAASVSNSDSDDDTLSDSSGPPQTKIKVEMVDGFSIMSAASDLKHTARGLAWQGAPTS